MARRKKGGGGHGGGGGHDAAGGLRWLLTYADMITLLLGMFILLFSVHTKPDEGKVEALAEAFERYFKIFPKKEEKIIVLNPQEKIIPPSPTTNLVKTFYQRFYRETKGGEVQIKHTADNILIRLRDTVLFDIGSAHLREEGKRLLDKITQILLEHDKYDVRVEGHTCKLSISTSKYPSNWELSCARASSVVRYIQNAAKNKLKGEELEDFKKRFVALGYADTKLIAPPFSPLNRRIDICLIPKKSQKETVETQIR